MSTRIDGQFEGAFNPEVQTGAPPRETRLVLERKEHPHQHGREVVAKFVKGDPEGPRMEMRLPQELVYHSPSGFEYGYGGSGPADLALNILAEFVDRPTAWILHQHFKADLLAPLDFDENRHVIPTTRIYNWLAREFRKRAGEGGWTIGEAFAAVVSVALMLIVLAGGIILIAAGLQYLGVL